MISHVASAIQQKFSDIKVVDILNLRIDIIIKYMKNDGNIQTVPIFQTYLQKYFGSNLQEFLINALKFYISTKNEIQILNIFEYPKRLYKYTDFGIQVLRVSGNDLEKLLFVKIVNKKTGVILNDWVRPEQISSQILLNELICWEINGNEISF